MAASLSEEQSKARMREQTAHEIYMRRTGLRLTKTALAARVGVPVSRITRAEQGKGTTLDYMYYLVEQLTVIENERKLQSIHA